MVEPALSDNQPPSSIMEEDKGGTTDNTKKKTWLQKYGKSLKMLLPYRRPCKDKTILPSGRVGCISFASLTWLSNIMWNAYRKGVQHSWTLAPEDRADRNVERLDRLWNEALRRDGKKASFPCTIWRFVRTRTIVAIMLVFIYSSVNIITPSILFKMLMSHLEEGNDNMEPGLYVVGGMIIAQLLRIGFYSSSWTFSAHTGMRIQGAIKLFLFRKALSIRNRSDRFMSEVIQSISVETDRVYEATARGISSFSTVVVLLYVTIYSTYMIGVWSLLGVFVLLCAFPITTLLARGSAIVRRKAIPYTEDRIHIMNEVLSSIRLIKMYAWEIPFSNKVADVRNTERKILQQSAFIHSISQTTSPVICIIAAVATFLGHTLSGNTITASEAFSIFSVFAAARFALATTTNNAKFIADAIMGCRKMQGLVLAQEVENSANLRIPDSSDKVIIMESATFSWKEEIPQKDPIVVEVANETENDMKGIDNLAFAGNRSVASMESGGSMSTSGMLKNVDMKIKKGSLVGICGSVGSGKSSLISAIFGDMYLVDGQLGVKGSIAYVPQQTWVHCGTLRENILFGLPMERNRYESILEACCLVSDLNLLPNGDATEIGERGVNLSGGQRQRINLARALYSDRDIYLLDDPLSAVDTRVAKHIFSKAIRGILKEKTVLMVTHGMHLLEQCDHILLVDYGTIVEQGNHKQLLNKSGRYSQMFNFVEAKDQEETTDDENENDNEGNEITSDCDPEKGRLVVTEETKQGQVAMRTYLAYVKASGGYFVAFIVFVVFLLHMGTTLFNMIWLQRWLDDGDGSDGTPFQKKLIRNDEDDDVTEYDLDYQVNETLISTNRSHPKVNHNNILDNDLLWMYALVYGMSVVLLVLTGVLQSFLSTLIALVASSKLHDRMFAHVLRCPMSFFDTNPIGRILNRFSKDMDELDYTFPFQLGYVIQYILYMVAQMVLVAVIYPWCSIALGIILCCMIFLDIWLHPGIREMKRMESVARSKIIVQLTSAMQGLNIIRVFGKESIFTEKFKNAVNEQQNSYMLFYCTQLWFAFRMEMLGSALIITTGLMVVLNPNTTPALAGLALSSAFQVTQIITGLFRNKSDLQARFIAVERIVEYAKALPQEETPNQKTRLPPAWPADGSIIYRDVCLSYRPGLPLVLKGVNCHIKGGEKIGVIGRTGAGKTSLIGTLLRLTEIDSGMITIDGIDISNVALCELRSVLAVIPQEPILFQGTIRYNLDPFDEYTDEMLWSALELSHLKEKIVQESKQLEAIVDADGENFSVGEKQLICLARTILRKNKILLLDEATAFVDVETDFKIQKTIRDAFAECTVLTIAHRLNTIWDSDRILVMDSGRVAEFDSPEALMSNQSSFFRAMMHAMGVTHLTPTNNENSATATIQVEQQPRTTS